MRKQRYIYPRLRFIRSTIALREQSLNTRKENITRNDRKWSWFRDREYMNSNWYNTLLDEYFGDINERLEYKNHHKYDS